MGSLSDSILVEIIIPVAQPSKKSTIISTFQNIFTISEKAAIPGKVDPGLGFKAYNHVTAHDEASAVFLYWKNMEHHDTLAATPGFAEGGKLFENNILPNLEGELQIYYLATQQKEMALKDAEAAEVIEVRYSGAEDAGQLEMAVAATFKQLKSSQGFLGYFSGPKHGDPEIYVIVTKWSSKSLIDNAAWVKDSEGGLLGALGGKAQIEKRLQMYS